MYDWKMSVTDQNNFLKLETHHILFVIVYFEFLKNFHIKRVFSISKHTLI